MVDINNKTKSKIDLQLVKKIVENFLKYYKKENKDVSIAFVGDILMCKLNKQYRGKDKATDILSFEGDDNFLGELIIDYAQIKRQAKKYSKSIKQELIFILVHGLLHLIGYDDDTDEGIEEMDKLTLNFIEKL